MSAKIDAKSDKSTAIDMLNQHEQTEQGIARLYGQLEELKHELEAARKDQKSLYADLDARIKKLEPQQTNIDGKIADVLPIEKLNFDAAWDLFKSGDYKGASDALADFVRRYPASAYAPGAQYWLGSAYYAQRDYKGAIAAQEVVARNYKDSVQAPDAMLNIASSYTGLNDKKAAKKILQQLISAFPASPAAQEARNRLAALK
ncbi:tol-pal system protein YbgF [Pseudoduganella sp. UC29_106]|uniref:tol-pal system protein YbgF n=1 Tax=Pseudoduganella sp. UC29_106 TaxID=3374553 RepID=UPI003758003B